MSNSQATVLVAAALATMPFVADARTMATALCFGVVEEVTGHPAWWTEQLVQACRDAPYEVMVRLKGAGNVLTPIKELQPAPPPRKP